MMFYAGCNNMFAFFLQDLGCADNRQIVRFRAAAGKGDFRRLSANQFSDLTPGQYQVAVSVNYAVIGRKENGEAKVDVKAGETTTASVPLSQAK